MWVESLSLHPHTLVKIRKYMYPSIIETYCVEKNLYHDHRIHQRVLVQDPVQSKFLSGCKSVGTLAGKFVKFIKRNETKVSFLIVSSSVDTFITTVIITAFAFTNPIFSSILLVLWVYRMYCQSYAIQSLAVHGD